MEDEGQELASLKAEVAALRAHVDLLEARVTVSLGPDGTAAKPVYAVTPEMLEEARTALACVGRFRPDDTIIRAWLALAGSAEKVLEGVTAILSRHKEKAEHPAAPEPSEGADWREAAAYFEFTDAHAGWSRVTTYLAEGVLPPVVTSLDPERSVFVGITKAAGPDDMKPIVAEVLKRAEEGVSWAGHQGTSGAELAKRKELLRVGKGGKGWRKEWDSFVDPRLLRVGLLTNAIPATQPPLGAYKVGIKQTMTLEEWLFAAWKSTRPFPGSPHWKAPGA